MNNKLEIKDYKEAKSLAVLVVNVAQVLVENGAEIYRVEDTALRMCSIYNEIRNVNIYATYNLIMVSFTYEDEDILIMRRISKYTFDLSKITEINNFSRKFVAGEYNLKEGYKLVRDIGYGKYQSTRDYLIFGTIGSAMLIFNFGGNIYDFIVALFAGFSALLGLKLIAKVSYSSFFNNMAGAFMAAVIAVLGIKLRIGTNIDIVITGAMIPLFPGISFNNSIRDFISGDIMSGVHGLAQSILVAAGMAVGVSAVLFIYY